MMFYIYDEQGFFEYEDEAFLDPEESKLQGKNVYLTPPNSTTKKPLENKEGFFVRFNGEDWVYEEIPKETEQTEPTLDELKQAKIQNLKAERDTEEIAPLNNYDVDEKSLQRIDVANKILLSGVIHSIDWTMSDNSVKEVTADDFENLYIALAMRSNALHEAYRNAKEMVKGATTKDEIDEVKLL